MTRSPRRAAAFHGHGRTLPSLPLLLLCALGAGCASGPSGRRGTVIYGGEAVGGRPVLFAFTTEESLPWGLGNPRPLGGHEEAPPPAAGPRGAPPPASPGGDPDGTARDAGVFPLTVEAMGQLFDGFVGEGLFRLPPRAPPVPGAPPTGRFILVLAGAGESLGESPDGGPFLVRKDDLSPGSEEARTFTRLERILIQLTMSQPSYGIER